MQRAQLAADLEPHRGKAGGDQEQRNDDWNFFSLKREQGCDHEPGPGAAEHEVQRGADVPVRLQAAGLNADHGALSHR